MSEPLVSKTRLFMISLIVLVVTGGTSWAGYVLTGSKASGLDRTELPQWIAAVSTLLTVLAASIAATYAGATIRLELKRDERWSADRASEQAALVAAWPQAQVSSLEGVLKKKWRLSETEEGVPRLNVLVMNGSPVPVDDVTIEIYFILTDLELAPDASDEPIFFGSVTQRLVPPLKEPWSLRVDRDDSFLKHSFLNADGALSAVRIVLSLTFVDSAGRSWRRFTNGLELGREGCW